MQKLKNVLSYLLGKEIGPRGKRWFVRHGSRKRVKDPAHLGYLVDSYFPDHRGLFWKACVEQRAFSSTLVLRWDSPLC
jgi:hypothetical protein